jgi:hypothetical protein
LKILRKFAREQRRWQRFRWDAEFRRLPACRELREREPRRILIRGPWPIWERAGEKQAAKEEKRRK